MRIFKQNQAYLQFPVDKIAKPYLMVNTHWGQYVYNCLSFGVPSELAMFMKTVVYGISGVIYFIEDILIPCKQSAWRKTNLETIRSVYSSQELWIKQEKYEYLLLHLEYLGINIEELQAWLT